MTTDLVPVGAGVSRAPVMQSYGDAFNFAKHIVNTVTVARVRVRDHLREVRRIRRSTRPGTQYEPPPWCESCGKRRADFSKRSRLCSVCAFDAGIINVHGKVSHDPQGWF